MDDDNGKTGRISDRDRIRLLERELWGSRENEGLMHKTTAMKSMIEANTRSIKEHMAECSERHKEHTRWLRTIAAGLFVAIVATLLRWLLTK